MIDFNLKLSLQEQLTPILEQLEKERQLIITRNYNIIGTLSGVVFSSIFIAIYMENPIVLVVSIALNLAIYFLLANKGADAWATKYKQDVIGAVVKNFFGQYGSYEPFSGHNETEFIDTELFSTTPDRYHSEDLIKGKVDKTSISFSEVHAEYKTTTNKGGTSWHTLFRGILFTADFNKHFKGRTIAKQKGFWRFISFGNIELENPEFRNEFAVYGDDGVEARYILSPTLMEKMLILNRNWGGSLGFSFIGSQLTIAIPMDTNFFEISHWSKIELDNKWLNDWQIIADLTNIVHDLDLNTRIWTKE